MPKTLYVSYEGFGGQSFYAVGKPVGGGLYQGVMRITVGDDGELSALHLTYHQVKTRGGKPMRKPTKLQLKAAELMRGMLPAGSIVEVEYDERPEYAFLVLRTAKAIQANTAKSLGRKVASEMGPGWEMSGYTDDIGAIRDHRFGGEAHYCRIVPLSKS